MRQFPGIHCVPYALFDEDERLDRKAMAAQVANVIAAGVDGVTVLGLATEVAKLSAEERRAVIDWAAEDVAGRVPLSVTIAGNHVVADLERWDILDFEGFGYANPTEVLARMTQTEGGVVFADQGTRILLADAMLGQLGADMFNL